MRRLGRWVFNTLTVLSLVMCMATAALWWRSMRWTDEVRWAVEWRDPKQNTQDADGQAAPGDRVFLGYGVQSHVGQLWIGVKHLSSVDSFSCHTPGLKIRHFRSNLPYGGWFGFAGRWDTVDNPLDVILWRREVAIPYWVCLAGGLLVLWRSLRARRQAGAKPKCVCPRCGYDLRATPDRCPECGTAAKGAAT